MAPSAFRALTRLSLAASAVAIVLREGPMPWEEARAKAEATAEEMTQAEMDGIVRGVHFSALTGGPEPGYFTGSIEPIPRLGVPALKMADAGNGFRPTNPGEEGTTTCWPSLLSLASTFSEGTVYEVAKAIGAEFHGKGANVILGPSVNVHRIARNGRNFEYISGEDPHLGAVLTSAYVKGVQSQGVMATAKHYAFNEQETNRMGEDSQVDDRTAWELYYPPFQAAVDAGIGGIMCAYNKVNGTYASANSNLLVRDLREKMGFKGVVMSDWTAVHEVGAIDNGMDVEMPGHFAGLPPFVEINSFKAADLNKPERLPHVKEAATHVLTAMYRMGMDKNPGCVPPHCTAERATDQTSDEHRDLARSAATEALILLQNDGILPLDPTKVKKLGVMGDAAHTWVYYAGGGSGSVPIKDPKTPFDLINKRAAPLGVEVFFINKEADIDRADAVLAIGGTYATEGMDRLTLAMDGGIDSAITWAAAKKPTVVYMMTPGAVTTPWRSNVAAILNQFFGGEEAGAAAAAVLFGDASPGGKLPIMLPASDADQINPSDEVVLYSEGLFTSYRSDKLKAAFPFGHGLSYTTFEIEEPKLLAKGRTCAAQACVALTVRNTGSRPGAEVVQAYIEHFLRLQSGELAEAKATPKKSLRAFKRTSMLAPGESEEVVLSFQPKDLSIYRPGEGWVMPSFGMRAHIGASSEDIRHVVEL
mmetsp:Transcript_102613/g.209004  ORF Transcript_102613/g.209004 Transcript_102613/m.209004 type:complete len:703 (-) Transcript_102613:84-2192(-)